MDHHEVPPTGIVLTTERLVLRRWRVADAPFQRRLWKERDPRVPAHRRLSADGHPTVAELEQRIRREDHEPAPGLLVVERRSDAAAIGYCGLVAGSVGRPEEPELAYEFLQEAWHQGYAGEAARAVIELARSIGFRHLIATVREWNTASFRVLARRGFTDTGQREPDPAHGDSLLWRLNLADSAGDAPSEPPRSP